MVEPAPHKSVAQLLLDSARQDEAACKLLSTGVGIGDAMVGFHAQQAVEKSLKAVLSAHGMEFRRTHDLLTLLDLLSDHGLPPPPAADWVDNLNPYAVEARYGMVEPNGLDRHRAALAAQQIVAWATTEVASPTPKR
jgi:HEPN domain-containing protein